MIYPFGPIHLLKKGFSALHNFSSNYVSMDLPISTYALLFPAVSLLFLSYTNRFLHLSALIRKLHLDWVTTREELLFTQIENLKKRLILIRWMQFIGAVSLLLSVLGMIVKIFDYPQLAAVLFISALIMMCFSLLGLIIEIWISGGALRIVLSVMEKEHEAEIKRKSTSQKEKKLDLY